MIYLKEKLNFVVFKFQQLTHFYLLIVFFLPIIFKLLKTNYFITN